MGGYVTTSITRAAVLHACGFPIVGARVLDAADAEALREEGDRQAREGSIAFELRGDTETQEFRDALCAAETRGAWIHIGRYARGVRKCREWIGRLRDTDNGR